MKNKKARFGNLLCFPQMSFRKRGWMMILEATIAILIVSGALLVVYSQQTDRSILPEEYYDDLQGQILADVSSSSDLRLNVLNVVEENSGDENFKILNEFIGGKIPEGFGYSIRVCKLGDETDFCKLDSTIFIATLEKDIYTEEIIIASELGSGFDAVYNPKKLRLFVWEGEIVETECEDECSPAGPVYNCSGDSTQVLKRTCGDFDADNCLEWKTECAYFFEGKCHDYSDVVEVEVSEECGEGEVCVDGDWGCEEEAPGYFNLTCEKTKSGVVHDFNDECDGWDTSESECLGFEIFGECVGDESYTCYDYEEVECSVDPECPDGYDEVEKRSCVSEEPCVDECTEDKYKCSAGLDEILIQECGDFDDDECDEYDPEFKVDEECDTGEECVDEECVKKVAVLNASYVLGGSGNTGSFTRFYFDSIISEIGGNVGATINSRQKCYYSPGPPVTEWCDDEKYDIILQFGTDYIIPNGQISNPTYVDLINGYDYTVTETFWGTDDNENSVQASYSFSVTA